MAESDQNQRPGAQTFHGLASLRQALAEMRRVTRKGGTVSASVWDYGDGMESLRIFWDEAVGLDPAAAPKHERNMKLTRQGELGALWRNLREVFGPLYEDFVVARYHEKPLPGRGGELLAIRSEPRLLFPPDLPVVTSAPTTVAHRRHVFGMNIAYVKISRSQAGTIGSTRACPAGKLIKYKFVSSACTTKNITATVHGR